MIQSAIPSETLLCTDCGEEKPVTEFRRRRRGSEKRHHQCRTCFNLYMRLFNASRRNQQLAEFVRELSNWRKTAGRVPVLAKAMTKRLGGLNKVCGAWTEHIRTAAVRRPGSRMVLQSFQAIVRIIALADVERKKGAAIRASKVKRRDVKSMSDEELEQELRFGIESLIRDHPELAVAAAGRIGWTVIPPSQDQRADRPPEAAKHRQSPLAAET